MRRPLFEITVNALSGIAMLLAVSGCGSAEIDPLLLAEPARSYLDSMRTAIVAQYYGPNPRLAMQENGCLFGRMSRVLDSASRTAVERRIAYEEKQAARKLSRAEMRRVDSTLGGVMVSLNGDEECNPTDSAWRMERRARRNH
jgi:hypothetical protein